jgi:hypothetical protein
MIKRLELMSERLGQMSDDIYNNNICCSANLSHSQVSEDV